MTKKTILHLLLFLVIPTFLLSQSKTEIGLFAGSSIMQGDINADATYKEPSYAIGALMRYNLNRRYVLRLQANYFNLKASDSKSTDAYRLARNASFSSNIFDVTALFEFNFLEFKFAERYNSSTTYVNTGIGMHFAGPPIGAFLPLTVGYKHTLGKRWCIGVEYSLKKTFSDKFDGIINPVEPLSIFNNNDWYSLMGITLTYKIFDDIRECPAYENAKTKWK